MPDPDFATPVPSPVKSHIVGILVNNEPGVLTRISALFMKRHFNIETLTVSPTTKHDVSRITLSFFGDEQRHEQVVKQLSKLIDVLKVFTIPEPEAIIRDLCLIKLKTADESGKKKAIAFLKSQGAALVHENDQSIIGELIAVPQKIDKFLNESRSFGIVEIARTGLTALATHPEGHEE